MDSIIKKLEEEEYLAYSDGVPEIAKLFSEASQTLKYLSNLAKREK